MSVEKALEWAVQQQQAGRFGDAEAICRQVLSTMPNHAPAWDMLGVVLGSMGRMEEAIGSFQRAIEIAPTQASSYFNLGVVFRRQGRTDDALACFRKVIALQPDQAVAYDHLGELLAGNGQYDAAMDAFQRCISLRPDFARAHECMGYLWREKGNHERALECARRVVQMRPNQVEAHYQMGNTHAEAGCMDEAIESYRAGLQCQPQHWESYNNLGNALAERGRVEEALAAYREVVRLNPNFPEGHCHLGNTLVTMRRLEEGIASLREALRLRPNFAEAHKGLGMAFQAMGLLDQTIASYQEALRLQPESAKIRHALAWAYMSVGRVDQTVELNRQVLALRPDDARTHSFLVHALNYDPATDRQSLGREAREWDRRHGAPRSPLIRAHLNDRAPDRPLRIGYVSPDFRLHTVGLMMLPLFREHDRAQYEIFCYANVAQPDGLTEEFRRLSTGLRNIIGISDEQACQMIRDDRIDILVDLALHTGGNRLLLFAQKPAPVQVTYAGYPGTTGLKAIDYRLTDPYLDPPGEEDGTNSETTVRLPDTFWCFDPPDIDLAVGDLPALSRGVITFGCLNNFCKINDHVLEIWARILSGVGEQSRLLLQAGEGKHRQLLLDTLERLGCRPERIEFVTYQPRRQYLELYRQIDIGLDTVPYNGHTTSLDSYWMGVPVVTLVGRTVVGRAGLSQLTNLGLTDLIARTPEEFVRIATELARDRPRLASLRATLRARMEASPLRDVQRYTRGIEAAYRQMWRTWCAQ